MFHSVIFFIISAFALTLTSGEDTKCPTRGKTGQPLPDILSLVPGQAGFHAHAEIVGGQHDFTEIEETFNGGSKVGVIKFNDVEGEKREEIHYYLVTEEVFIIDAMYGCTTLELDSDQQLRVIDRWIELESFLNDIKPIGPFESLGPVALFDRASKFDKDQVQYVGRDTIDGISTTHYFFCAKDTGPYFDLYFDESKKYPIRLEILFPAYDNAKYTINYVYFEPLIPKKDEPIAYPWGQGCDRSKSPTLPVPRFFEGFDPLLMEIEAALFFTNPDRSALMTAQISRLNGIYSYELNEGNTTTRIVHDPELLVDWIIDPYSGFCLETEAEITPSSYHSYLRWPYSKTEKYNLLEDRILELGTHIIYMGQIDTESGRMDIFEKTEEAFFVYENYDGYYDALITYFFPVMDTTGTRYQAPSKIIITPQGDPEDISTASLATKIELVVINWLNSKFDYEDRYDISNCYDEPGQYTWFQVAFSDTPQQIVQYEAKENEVREVFEEAISTIIPKVRLPEIRVTFLGSNMYITGKLIEAPEFKFTYYSSENTALEDPTKVLVLEKAEDCIEYCLEEDCDSLAYCDNMNCQISSKHDEPTATMSQTGCTYYMKPPDSMHPGSREQNRQNVLKSSKALLYKLKETIEQGKFDLGSFTISAEDLFIVNGPDEIGGVDDEFDDDRHGIASGDDFKVISSGNRLVDGIKTLGITYQECLNECVFDDDCYLLSYCPSSRNQECMITSAYSQTNSSASKDLTVISEGCNVFLRKASNFFTKFPGRSLVVAAKSYVKKVDAEECAQACETEKKFTCESFDYCPEPFNIKDQKIESGCFLHTFHLAKDTKELDGSVWNFNGTGCDHYSRKYSKDYQHYLGRRLEVSGAEVIGQTEGVLLETCAISCNSAEEGCNSFEFCEAMPRSSHNSSMTSCRISKFRPTTGAKGLQSTVNRCSVYVSKNSRNLIQPEPSSSGSGLAIGLGSFIFILALAAGLVGTHVYLKRRPLA